MFIDELWGQREVILEKVKFGMSYHLEPDFMLDIDADYYIDHITRNVAFKFKTEILGQKLEPIQYPANWKESFKERWFPEWLLKKYPVRYQVIDIKTLYPDMQIPGQRAVFHVKEHHSTGVNFRGE